MVSEFNLPEISFVGGTSKDVVINMNATSGGTYDADSVYFAITDYVTKSSPVVTKSSESGGGITLSADVGGNYSIATVALDSTDTKTMSGKYIYQVTVKNAFGDADPNMKGVMYIFRNDNQDAIS